LPWRKNKRLYPNIFKKKGFLFVPIPAFHYKSPVLQARILSLVKELPAVALYQRVFYSLQDCGFFARIWGKGVGCYLDFELQMIFTFHPFVVDYRQKIENDIGTYFSSHDTS
jgi:hypothetical protein